VSGGDALVALRGEFDLTNHDELRDALLAGRAAASLTVDLSEVRFIDWTGIALILAAATDMRDQGGRAVLASCSPAVRRILHALRVDYLLAS
jgi:anti-anti-sigma factor